MKFKQVKKVSEMQLSGITIDLDQTGDTLNSVTFTDTEGHTVRVRYSSYSMYVEVPAPPAMVKKHLVSGKLHGVVVSESFDEPYPATLRVRELREVGAEVELTEIEVPEEA